jgi:lantibiotic modifying enzyme
MPEAMFLETADRIGCRLCRDAVWSGRECNWLGWAMETLGGSWSTVYRAQSANLYDGTAGIALFLARLYQFTQDKQQKTACIGALNHAFVGMNAIHAAMRPSVYSGCLGIAYASIEIGHALGDFRMIERGLRECKDARNSAPDETWLDVISGCAGAIQVLLDIARRYDCPDLVDRAREHGQVLLRKASMTGRGWSWDTLPGASQTHLLGYGHGAGGIGCALLDLWKATGDAKYHEAAQQAFCYERSYFSAEQHNWPDLRPGESIGIPAGQPIFSLAWCHGAPGVGLSRLRAHELLPGDESILAELNEALQTTVSACSVPLASGGNLSLCHGSGGNADLLIAAADSLARSNLRAVAESVGQQALALVVANDMPWPCGVNGGGETPNLMLGLAGIGHFYLRLFDSVRVPSILLVRGGEAPAYQGHSLSAAAD